MKLFDSTLQGLERAMDLRFRRHAVLTSNLANSETPNYRAREIDFGRELEKAFGASTAEVSKTDPRHLDIGFAETDRVVFDNTGAMGADGNNVDLDLMTGKISDNGRAYENAANMVVQKLRLLRNFTRRGAV